MEDRIKALESRIDTIDESIRWLQYRKANNKVYIYGSCNNFEVEDLIRAILDHLKIEPIRIPEVPKRIDFKNKKSVYKKRWWGGYA